MRIMHLLNSNSYSGAENVVIEIIACMKKRDVECIYVSPSGPIELVLKRQNIPYCLVDNLSIKEVVAVVEKYQPDIIHAHDFTASIILAMSRIKRPIISHLHNNPSWIKRINLKTIVYTCSSIAYKKILLVSEAIEKEFIFHGIMKMKGEVIGNPISLNKIIYKSNEVCNEKYDIVFLGRLTEQKDPIRFLELIQKISEKYTEISCVMIGDGELRQKCLDEISEKHLQNNVKILGFQENPYPILKNSKMLCMPSKWEGFGLAAVEALTLGVPVLCTPVGGLVRIVDDSCGKICKCNDEFLMEMNKIIDNENYRKLKSENALKKAKKLENIEEYISRLWKIYQEIKEC